MSQYSRQIRYKYSLPNEYILTDKAEIKQKLDKFFKVILVSKVAKADLKGVIGGAKCVISDQSYLEANEIGVPVIPADPNIKDLQKIIQLVIENDDLRQALVEKVKK